MANITHGYMRGNQAAAEAARLSRIEFMGAYPIPPSSEIMEFVRSFIDEGKLNAGFIEAEGEKAAQAACYAAAAAGCRSFNATSSQGLLYMHELLHMMSGQRYPMVMVVANRSVFSPHGMLSDHTDSVSQRDTGWLQFYCETVQELFDTVIQAFKIAEVAKFPAMVCEDGYLLSHSLERVIMPTQEKVDIFLPPRQPKDYDHIAPDGVSVCSSMPVMDSWFTEYKYNENLAQQQALEIIDKVDAEFGEHFGRSYGGVIDPYMTEDAEVILLGMGSNMATVRYAVDIMRAAGEKVGMIKIRVFRPFPKEKLAAIIEQCGAKMIVVVEKTHLTALFDEVRSAVFGSANAPGVLGFNAGINGRDVSPYNIIDLFNKGFENIEKNDLKLCQMYFVRTMRK